MAPQLTARHIWNWERTKRALFLFLFGAMKKYAIANLTAPTIAAILDGNDPKLAGSMALLAICCTRCSSMQIFPAALIWYWVLRRCTALR